MKVTAEHLAVLRDTLTPLDTDERREAYRSGQFPRASLVQDVDKRYRWDLYWAAARGGRSLPDSTEGYNDAHIDTALRAVVPAL
jgi:hypothetical protein